MDNNKKDNKIKSKVQAMENEILEILDDDGSVDQKQLRESLIDSGKLPKGCMLNGRVSMIMILNAKDPCNGCNFDRDKCGGREYDPEKLAIQRVNDFKGYLEKAWIEKEKHSLTDIFRGELGEYQKRYLFANGEIYLPAFRHIKFVRQDIMMREPQRVKVLRFNRVIDRDFREQQAKMIMQDVKVFLDTKIYADFRDRRQEKNNDFRGIRQEDWWEAFLGVYRDMIEEANENKLWEPDWRRLNFRIVLPVDFFVRLWSRRSPQIMEYYPEFSMVNYEKVMSLYHHDKIGDVRGDELGYKIFLIRETEALILPMEIDIERGIDIQYDGELHIYRHQERYNMEFWNARINLGGDQNVVVRRIKW